MKLRQIILNLLGNAIKFTSEGHVEMRVEIVLGELPKWKIRVIDTGIGIPDDKQRSIFESFSQADNSTTRRFGGTGLGLSISTELVRLMNGEIEVTSQVDVGSEFTIVLPFNVETLPSQPLEKPVRRFSGQKFLVVDPCSAARRCVEQTIADYGGFAISFDAWFDLPLLDRPDLELFDGVIAAGIEAADLLDQASELGIRNWLAQGPDASQHANRNYLIKPCIGNEWITAMELVFSKTEPNTTAKSCRNLTPPKYDSEPNKHSTQDHHLKILVAEDGIVNQCVLVGLLELSGHSATVANNGREAAELLEHQEFDLVLMDLDMPELDGVQATRLIRSRGIAIPIYAMTAHHDQQHADQCHEAGMNGFLTKPINPNDLQRILAEVAKADERRCNSYQS